MELENRFKVGDYVIFALSLLISLGIGVYSAFTGRKQTTTDDFYFGSRDLNIVAVGLSMAATFLSAIAILGIPSEIYFNGISIALIVITDIVSSLLTIFVFVPFFYKLGLTSVYEYFELRFSRIIRRLACATFIINMLLYIAIVLFAPALALSQVSGLPLWACILSSGLICTIYTSIGGMKAVVWTDAFQMIVMFFGVLIILIVGVVKSAGIAAVWEANRSAGRLDISFDLNPTIRHTFWSVIMGGLIYGIPFGLNQATVQRYFSVKSQKAAQKMMGVHTPTLVFWKLCLYCIGLLTISYYRGCDPLMAGRIQRPDQLVALFVMDLVSFMPGFAGLFTAIVYSATLSTVSSGVNSIVVVINEDFIKPCLASGGGEKFFIRLSKWLSFFVGCATIGIAFAASLVGRNLIQFSLSIYGMCSGPLLGLFVCGFLLPYSNSLGAGIGLVTGLMSVFWLAIAAIFHQIPKPQMPALSIASCPAINSTFLNFTNLITTTERFVNCSDMSLLSSNSGFCFGNQETFSMKMIYNISYQYYGLIGFLITILVATIVSFLTGHQKASLIPDRFLLYKIYCKPGKKPLPVDSQRSYGYSSVNDIDLQEFNYTDNVNKPSRFRWWRNDLSRKRSKK